MSMERKKYVSAAERLMYAPPTSWDFFDAFNNSAQSQAAFQAGEISTENRTLNKYLAITKTQEVQRLRTLRFVPKPHIPRSLEKILQIQDSDGKFDDLDVVCGFLQLPRAMANEINRNEKFLNWEVATAFSIAFMRQHVELFDFLREAHDKACAVLGSSELLPSAKDVLSVLFFKDRGDDGDMDMTLSNELMNEINQSIPPSAQASKTEEFHLTLTENQSDFKNNNEIELKNTNNMEGSEEGKGETGVNPQVTEEDDKMNDTSYQEITDKQDNLQETFNQTNKGTICPPALSPSVSFFGLEQKLAQLTASVDKDLVREQEDRVNRIQLLVIQFSIQIEDLVSKIRECAYRCITNYNTSETNKARWKTFEELTSRLGEGTAAQPGLSDWRREGVPGLRPVVIAFLNAIFEMAEARLKLVELKNPQGKSLDLRVNVELSLSRWTFLWNGQNVVLKVLHCLDFLRKCRELCDWYGTSFYFIANPLMMPFNSLLVFDELHMEEKVQDHLQSAPHRRVGSSAWSATKTENETENRMKTETENRMKTETEPEEQSESDWQKGVYLNQWRRKFMELCENRVFNWPEIPDIKEDRDNERLFKSFVVLYVTCLDSIRKSVRWEKKFMGSIVSDRGKNKLLIGKSAAKPEKKLFLPKEINRKTRLSDIEKQLTSQQPTQKEPKSDEKEKKRKSVFKGKDALLHAFDKITKEIKVSNNLKIEQDLNQPPLTQEFQELSEKSETDVFHPRLKEAKIFNNLVNQQTHKVEKNVQPLQTNNPLPRLTSPMKNRTKEKNEKENKVDPTEQPLSRRSIRSPSKRQFPSMLKPQENIIKPRKTIVKRPSTTEDLIKPSVSVVTKSHSSLENSSQELLKDTSLKESSSSQLRKGKESVYTENSREKGFINEGKEKGKKGNLSQAEKFVGRIMKKRKNKNSLTPEVLYIPSTAKTEKKSVSERIGVLSPFLAVDTVVGGILDASGEVQLGSPHNPGSPPKTQKGNVNQRLSSAESVKKQKRRGTKWTLKKTSLNDSGEPSVGSAKPDEGSAKPNVGSIKPSEVKTFLVEFDEKLSLDSGAVASPQGFEGIEGKNVGEAGMDEGSLGSSKVSRISKEATGRGVKLTKRKK